jgi:hypothetical protein
MRRRVVLALLLAGYGLFFWLGGCADRLLLYPDTAPEDVRRAKRRLIPFEGGALEIWTARSPGATGTEPRAFVLTFVGNAARAEWSVTADPVDWADKPVEIWAVNHPGFGGSTGPAKLRRLGGAALAAYDALKQEAGTRPILVNGTSLGATMALHVAANRPVAGVILRTPPPLRNMILTRYGWWNLWLLAGPVATGVPGELNALKSAPRVAAPAVFVLFDTDEVVPLKYQQKVADAYGGEKHVIVNKGGNHNSALHTETLREFEAKLDWLWHRAGL